MEFWRSIFREDADEDEVNRVMMTGLVTSIAVAGTAYIYAPRTFRSLTSWWTRPVAPTPTPVPISPSISPPEPATSGRIIRDNRAATQNPPGAFIEQDGDGREMSPDDFTKPFWGYTEQDVANMKAGWKKCLEDRATDATTCTERTSQLQAEARNARQVERQRVAMEARRADAAETRADAAEAKTAKSEAELFQHRRRFMSNKLFARNPEDQREIARLREDNQDLQRQRDACVDSRRRSLVPNEVEELQVELAEAQRVASDRDKRLLEEIRKNRNITLREDKADKIIKDLLAKAGPTKRLQQIIDRDASIKSLRQELMAAKANANGSQQPLAIPADLSGEIDQLKIWLEEVRIELSGMVGAPIGEVRVFRKEGSKPNELAQLLREVQDKCERAEAYQDEVTDLKKEMKESNLADLRDEILTLNEQLAAVQAELRNERAPTGGARKPDDKIKKIITLENKLKDSERQRRESESSTNAADIRVAQLEVEVTRLMEKLQDPRSSASVGEVGTEKDISDLRRQLTDARRAKIEAERDLAKCQTKNTELVSKLEALKIELEQAKKDRDDCRDKDLPGFKQKIAQLETEVTRVCDALAGAQADLKTAEEELATLRSKSSGSSEAADAAAKKEIRMLTAKLDARTVALDKSRTKADETTTYVGKLMAQVDQLTREKAAAERSSGSNTAAVAAAQGKIRALDKELDGRKEALSKSGATIVEQKAKISDLTAQLDQLTRDSKEDGSKDSVALSYLRQERDAALSDAAQARQEADQASQQARTEVEQIRAAAIEKVQQADQRSRDAQNHWVTVVGKKEAQRVNLEHFLATERTQLKAMATASFAKDTQIEELKTQVENAKIRLENAEALKHAAMQTLHGEGTAVIDKLQEQLDHEQKARQILNDTINTLRERAFNLEQERNLHKWAAQAGATNNPTIIENTFLRQQVVDLQNKLVDMEAQARRKIDDLIANKTSANNQIVALATSLKTKDQLIADLNSKSKSPVPATATVPKHIYDALTKENDHNRSELRRVNDWKSKPQPQQNVISASGLQAEQLRRVQAEDRYNKLFPRIAALEKQLLAATDELILYRNAPVSPVQAQNLQQLIKLNGSLNADILRNNAKFTAQLADLAHDRDGLLQMLSERQREGGNNELADATAALRVQAGTIVELQKWKDEHEFMVEQSDRMAAATREIAKQQGDVDKARQQSIDAGFGSRGTVRKERERGEGENDSPPRKGSKQPRVEDGEGESLRG